MTGEMLFFKYAYPCLEARFERGFVSQEHKNELDRCMKNQRAPNRRRLKYCFPNAFKALRQTAVQTGKQVWSLANVKHHWRYNHNHSGVCAVQLFEVQDVSGNIVITAKGRFLNLYGLALTCGDRVYTHKGCVIEKDW